MTTKRVTLLGFVTVAWLTWPTLAVAQSAITGVVRDASGGVLPGVTVEASSDALIEKTRTVTTDGAGQYAIVSLRPGRYNITFSLTGFQSVRRDMVELPGEFTATINVELRVGSIEETVTVSGTSPTVDVQRAGHVVGLDRAALDNLPHGSTIQSIAQLIAGVNVNVPDVGGSRSAGSQAYMSVHGQSPAQNNLMIDGLPVNSLENNGQISSHFSDVMNQEISYQTSGHAAERSGGGVAVNMIPREGGNRFEGSGMVRHLPGQWQGDNRTDRLQDVGLQATNNVAYISDVAVAQGGPIKRDRLWFFAATNHQETPNGIANTFLDDGSQGVDFQSVRHYMARATWQISPRNKLGVFKDWLDKFRSHVMQSLVDPETAAVVNTWPNFSNGQIKYMSTVTSKLVLEAGFSYAYGNRRGDAQPGRTFDPFTPEWYAGASRTTQVAGPRTTYPASQSRSDKLKKNFLASASYVTGTHSVKVGFGHEWGTQFTGTTTNADLIQRYSTYVITDPVGRNVTFQRPADVIIRNTPLTSMERMNANRYVYGQDSWKVKRLTLNYGLRWEQLKSQIDEYTSGGGRFVPARTQPQITNVPNWKDVAPRFSMVYDPFGNAKTAIKYSVNRYDRAETTNIAQSFNALRAAQQIVTWVDLNGDDIAQGGRSWHPDGTYTDCVYLSPGCEINIAGQLRSNFGLLSDVGTYGNFPRIWNFEQGFEVERELMPRLSVTGSWFHSNDHNLIATVNRALKPEDFTELRIFNPIDGTPISYYNISAAANTRATDNVTAVEPLQKSSYDTYSFDFKMRPYAGAQIFGGLVFERGLNVACGTSVPGAIVDPNTLRFCDETQVGKPFAKDFRLAANFPLPWWNLNVSGSYLNNDEGGLPTTYTFSRSIRYPDGTSSYTNAGGQVVPACPARDGCVPGAITAQTLTLPSAIVALRHPDTLREERLKQLDLKLAKNFRLRGISIAPSFEMFNIFNSDKVLTRVSTSYANAAGTFRQPNSVMEGRIIGARIMVRW